VLGPDLEPASVVVSDPNGHDLAPVNTQCAAILDHDAAPLAAREAQNHLVTDLQRVAHRISDNGVSI